MTKTYELPKIGSLGSRRVVAEFDENGVGKITVQALDSLICELNEYADKAKVEIVVFEKESRKVLADIKQGDVSITRSDIDFRIFTDTEPIFTDKNGSVYFDDKWIMQIGEPNDNT